MMAIQVKDQKSAIMRLKFAVAVFGYANISRTKVEDYNIDPTKFPEDYGWAVTEGLMGFSVEPKINPTYTVLKPKITSR